MKKFLVFFGVIAMAMGTSIINNTANAQQQLPQDPYGVCCALVSAETCYTVRDSGKIVTGFYNGTGC